MQRWSRTLAVSLSVSIIACGNSDENESPAQGGTASSGSSTGSGGSSTGSGGSNQVGGASSTGGTGAQGATTGSGGSGGSGGGDTAGSGGTGSGGSILYEPPAAIVGGACEGTPSPASPPCSFAPEQMYCSLEDPANVIMAVCSSAGRTQCEVMSSCQPGWHACTATEYVARGGRDVPPDFSTTNRAWLAACVQDVGATGFKNEPCSVCGEANFDPVVQWWCDGQVVYEGGMAGDTLGVVAAPECMRVGTNAATHAAYWSMSFASGSPSFVMCCLDEIGAAP